MNWVVDADDLRYFRYADINRVSKSDFSSALSSWGYLNIADESLNVFESSPGNSYRRDRDGWDVIRCSLEASYKFA